MIVRFYIWSLLLAIGFNAVDKRPFRPEDLFQIRTVNRAVWSPDGNAAVIEISKNRGRLDNVPTSELLLIDTETGRTRVISSPSNQYLGFFNTRWSPDGKQLAFLSIDTAGVSRIWVWSNRSTRMLGKFWPRLGAGENPILWVGRNELLAN